MHTSMFGVCILDKLVVCRQLALLVFVLTFWLVYLPEGNLLPLSFVCFFFAKKKTIKIFCVLQVYKSLHCLFWRFANLDRTFFSGRPDTVCVTV